MSIVDQSPLAYAEIRDKPIVPELAALLKEAADRVGVAKVSVFSGGQPGTSGKSTGSTRHNGGRAADLRLLDRNDVAYKFTDTAAPTIIKDFVTECAALGATGIGAGVGYMGPEKLHVGYGLTPDDKSHVVWGAEGKSVNAPEWLRTAAGMGWSRGPVRSPVAPPVVPQPRPRPTPAPAAPAQEMRAKVGGAGAVAAAAAGVGAAIWNTFGWIGLATVAVVALYIIYLVLRHKKGKK